MILVLLRQGSRNSDGHIDSSRRAVDLCVGTVAHRLQLLVLQWRAGPREAAERDHRRAEHQLRDDLPTGFVGRLPARPESRPGEKILCTAQVGDQSVRVESTVTDEDYNVNFETLDTLYDLPSVGTTLSDELTNQLGFPVTVTCGRA